MATATEISTRALRRLALVHPSESPSAPDIAEANAALSAMIAAWDCSGFVGEVLPLASRFEAGIIAMLAVRLAESYGVTPGPVLMRDAERGEAQLNAAFIPIPYAKVDHALLMLPSTCAVDFPQALDHLPAWQVSTDYVLGDRVYNGNGIYLCVTAGTSATSGGPSSAISDITDGTVVWQFERVYGG